MPWLELLQVRLRARLLELELGLLVRLLLLLRELQLLEPYS